VSQGFRAAGPGRPHPNTEWLDGALDLTPHGGVVVDARGATGIPGVFTAGDCTTAPWKQTAPAT
jgi:alkyl hydroperoxide reductase subunit AhpF